MLRYSTWLKFGQGTVLNIKVKKCLENKSTNAYNRIKTKKVVILLKMRKLVPHLNLYLNELVTFSDNFGMTGQKLS